MDRRLTQSSQSLRFRIDPTRCDGQGVCALVAPELFALDRYGLGYVMPGSQQTADADPDVRARGLDADALCPRNAIREEAASPARPAQAVTPPAQAAATVSRPARAVTRPARAARTAIAAATPARLQADVQESIAGWQRRGGWADHDSGALLGLVEQAGIRGHGGAAFPAAAKWRRVAGAQRPVLVANGAEREPGTVKDRYLMARRPGLVLDGIRLAMRAVGAAEAIVAVDADATAEHEALAAAISDAAGLGLLAGCEIRLHQVPARYVAGEETALIGILSGGPALPRLRPPFPTDSGVFSRPTLVHNVETLAQVALAAVLGAEEFRSAGTADSPGTGLFSVGPFGGPYRVIERPYGYLLSDMLAEAGLLAGARAVLAGGYAGGLLPAGALDVPLTPAALAAAGASLGTKSVQVIGAGHCPVGVAADILGYFAGQSAGQCPPCSRGLPDMAGFLRGLENGTAGPEAVTDLDRFMRTLFDRGACRLPDGAARLSLSLLTNFPGEVAAHAASGCPFG